MAVPTMDEKYGAMYIGLLFATFFQGLLTVQAYTYYTNFPDDSRWLKGLVASVWMLDATHLILIAQATYHYLVTSWGNQGALLVATVPFTLHMVFVSVPSLLCQVFFLYRIWVLSQHNWLVTGFLGCWCLAEVCFEAIIIQGILRIPLVAEFTHRATIVKSALIVLAVGDLLIACTLVWYVWTTKVFVDDVDGVHRRTNFILRRIMQYAVATGLATSLVALATFAAFMLAPDTFIFLAIYFSFGHMYTNALLVSLNARRSLRLAIEQPTSIIGPRSWLVHPIDTQGVQSRNAHMGENNSAANEYPLGAVKIGRVESRDFEGEPFPPMAKVWSRNAV
ncbi:hypothetical protein C8F01DRAFT_1376488 [Mycena amicta]|nr:hypothetical protein C8F01DRAFT_1376488 [Mycena amicta]